ncbi:MAG: hypothetical protein AAGC56_08110 [Pseudomonadota bacterium]
MAGARSIIGGLTATGLATAAIVIGTPGDLPLESGLMETARPTASLIADAPDGDVCLSSELSFFAAAASGCLSKERIDSMRATPVIDNRGAAVAMELLHPSDPSKPARSVRTCADYARWSANGWYAATSREMRREAFFSRACGALSYLERAGSVFQTHFDGGRLSSVDVASLAEGASFGFMEAAAGPMNAADARQIRAGVWRIKAEGQSAYLQELAHADFNADGVGDILVFVAVRPDGGTASVGDVGFLTKETPNAPVRFRR